MNKRDQILLLADALERAEIIKVASGEREPNACVKGISAYRKITRREIS